MAPDQTLILVNGKRRHRSALVHFFAPVSGNGAHAVDVAMIPSIAIKSIEVLRDGAAAQYGSDAIAGVINFRMKDASEGGIVRVQYGQNYDDPHSINVAANAGLPLGSSGFVNLSVEYVDNEAIIRSIQRPDAAAAIAAGQQGVGQDAPFGEAPLAQTWGRPETSATRFFVNAGFDVSDTSELYFHANIGDSDGRYRFFFRNPPVPSAGIGAHSVFGPMIDLYGYDGVLLESGFTPYLDGAQKDLGMVGGFMGEFSNGMIYDFSIGYGKHELDYFLNNAVNPSIPLGADGEPQQRDFDVGGFEQTELNLNANFSKALSDTVNLAFGAEWREESYTMIVGEPSTLIGTGTALSGFSSPSAEDAGKFTRDNYAVYIDIEHDITDRFFLQYAARYEDFSDFGDTLIGKLAGRFTVTDAFTIRGAVSTGFKAPTPGQANIRSTITTFDGSTGDLVLEGLIPATHPDAMAVGGRPLTEETSVNYSVGFVTDIGDNTTLTVDYYMVQVDDRIFRTGDISTGAGTSVSFYTNALNLEHQGIDLVLTSAFDWSPSVSTIATFAFAYNKVDVVGQIAVQTPSGPVTPVNDGNVEDIENNFPNERFVLSTNTLFAENWNFMLRANYYGSHYDERGRIGMPSGSGGPSAKIDPVIYFDMELGFNFNDNLRAVIGAANVFDSFVNTIGPPNSNRLSVGLPYPRRTPANYEGGSWYLRGTFTW
jgi:iron complex outermembrane receptor protein